MSPLPTYAIKALSVAASAPICLSSPVGAATQPVIVDTPSVTNSDALLAPPRPYRALDPAEYASDEALFDALSDELADLGREQGFSPWDCFVGDPDALDIASTELEELHIALAPYRRAAGAEFTKLTNA